MIHKTTKIINLHNKMINEFKDIFIKYQDYIEQIPTQRGYYSKQSTYKALQVIEFYLRVICNYNLLNVTVQSIIDYCQSKAEPNLFLIKVKRFAFVLQSNNLISKDLYDEIDEIKITKRKNRQKYQEIGKEYKFIIPYERWKEIYTHRVIKRHKPRIMAVYLALNLALRQGELLNAKTTDLFLQSTDPFYFVQPHSEDNWHPKTLDSIRRLYLDTNEVKQFNNYLTWREQFLESKNKKHDFLLFSAQGDPYSSDAVIWKWLESVTLEFLEYGKSIIRNLRPHVLRYSSAWFYFSKTRNLYAVSKFLGHRSVTETEKYLGLTQSQIFDEIKNMVQQAFRSSQF